MKPSKRNPVARALTQHKPKVVPNKKRERPGIEAMDEAFDAFDYAQDLEELWDQHGGYWGEHPEWLVSFWEFEVVNGDTRKGYWEWVESQIANKEDEQ